MAQSEERVIWKGFGKNVSLLHVSGNIADINGVPDKSLEMMIFQRDVLGPIGVNLGATAILIQD